MSTVDAINLTDDADGFDALEEELGQIDANAIRVNAASRWPRTRGAGDENGEEDGGSSPRPPRRFYFGDAWDAKQGDEARGWMHRAENALLGAASRPRDELAADAVNADAADSERDDARDDASDVARTEDGAPEHVARKNDVRLIIGIVFAFVACAIVVVAVRMTMFRSPMRAAKQFAVARISNLPAVVRLDPARVVDMQRRYIHDIEEERVILLERLRRERTELAEVRSEARAWRNAYTRCRLQKRDLFTDRELPRIHSPLRWSPAWSYYNHARSPWLLVALGAASSFARRFVCPCVLRAWKTFQTIITRA